MEENIHNPATRKELQEALERSEKLRAEQETRFTELMARLEAVEAKPLSAIDQRRLADAEAELAQLKRGVSLSAPQGPAPKLIPYKGSVQAMVDCHIGGAFRHGPDDANRNRPSLGKTQGDVFYVEVGALWSDDPYVPVMVVRTRDDGMPETKPNPDAPPQIDFRFRPRGHDAFTAMGNQSVIARNY